MNNKIVSTYARATMVFLVIVTIFSFVFTAFAAENTPPVVHITGPVTGTALMGGSSPLTATATDNVGVVGVQFILDGNVNLGSPDTSSPYSGSWDLTAVSNGNHTLAAHAWDAAGNSATSIIDVIVDNEAPAAGTIIVNNGDVVTTSTNVTLTLSATDAVTAITEMRLSNTGTFGASEPYSITTAWALSAGSGTKTVYVQFKDAAGNWSPTSTDTIDLNTDVSSLGVSELAWFPCGGSGPLSTSPITTQSSGSTILVWVARQFIADFSVLPTDNKGNTYSLIGSVHDYSPLWPGSAEAMYQVLFANGGSNHIFTAGLPQNQEATIAAVEIKNGGSVVEAQWNKVLTGSPNTSLNVTVNGPATLIALWAGDGAAEPMTATPNNGFTVIESQLINTTCAIQTVMASKEVTSAGTYNVTWTETPDQGAHLWLIAVQAGDPDTTPPSVPGNLVANAVSASQINLTWDASTDNVGVTGYKVYRNDVLIASPVVTSFNDSGLAASTTYTYTVKAVDGEDNESAISAPAQATTFAGDTTPPVVSVTGPTGVLAAGTTSASLTVTTNENATCRYAATSGVAYASMTLMTTTGGTSHSSTISGLSNGNSYTYYVKCRDVALNISADASTSFSVASGGGGGSLVQTNLKTQMIKENTSVISVTSSAFTPSNNSFLVASVVVVNHHTPGTITVSGGGLTWTRLHTFTSPNAPSDYRFVQEVWTAQVTTGASMTLTVAGTGTSDSSDHCRINLQVLGFTGHDVANPIGATASGSNLGAAAGTITLSAAPATNSIVLATRGTADNGTVNSTATPGAGWTEAFDQATSGGYGDLETMTRTGSTSTAVTWDNLAVPSGASLWESAAFALEIKAAP
jgi:hypothetical protein